MTNAQRQAIGIDSKAFNAASEADRVLWAKANTTVGFGLCKEAQEWLKDRKNGVWVGAGCLRIGSWTVGGGCIYRLSPDYQPPVAKWWFLPHTGEIRQSAADFGEAGFVEVTAGYAEILRAKPAGDVDLRMVKKGDVCWYINGWQTAVFDSLDVGMNDRGYRWCKVKPAAAWTDDASELLASIKRDLVRLAEMLAKHKGAK